MWADEELGSLRNVKRQTEMQEGRVRVRVAGALEGASDRTKLENSQA